MGAPGLPPTPYGVMRIRNPELLTELHLRWRECAVCGATAPLSLHHIIRHPRDDVEANLVMVCGSGTTGCHGHIEERNTVESWQLSLYIRNERPDTWAWINEKFPQEGADHWLRRVYGA